MEIVAWVLHEWRIPIKAILSAGGDIRGSLLEDKDSMREKETIIIALAMRLMNLGAKSCSTPAARRTSGAL
jgi:hypothetical protein